MEGENIKPGIYEHTKTGHKYRVLGTAKHSETLEDMVVYEALYDNDLSQHWVRPIRLFVDEIEVDGQKQPRFKFVANDTL